MLYTRNTENEFFTDGQFNYDALEQITNTEVCEKLKTILISPVAKISVKEGQLKMLHIGITSTMNDVIYILFDSHYNTFHFNFINSLVIDELDLKITHKK